MVDDECIFVGSEKLGKLDLGWCAIGRDDVEDIVFGNETAGWQRSPGYGNGLHGATKPNLFFQQPISRSAILGRLIGEVDTHAFHILS